MKPILKKLKGFDSNYFISSNGTIKLNNERLIPHIDKKNGHLYFFLRKDGHLRKYYAFKLVAEAFLVQPYGFYFITHIDKNKQNNNIENLKYIKNIK